MAAPVDDVFFAGTPPSTADITAIARRGAQIRIGAAVEARILAGREVVDRYVAADLPSYGLTTGLGAGADTRLDADDLVAFQRRVPHARAVGVGAPLSSQIVRAMMAARIAGMAAGGTGVSLPVFLGLVAALNAGFHPLVPSLGSIGAGDIAPLAHMGSALLGHGEAEFEGVVVPAADALAMAGLAPLPLSPKDGHALVVANSLSVGRACLCLEDIGQLLDWSLKAVALDFEAFRANATVFDDRALRARPAFGQREAASRLRDLLAGSSLLREGGARRL